MVEVSEIPITQPRVNRHDALCIRVNSGWEWGHIYISHGKRPGRAPSYEWHLPGEYDTTWVSVSAVSDYGVYGHVWSHCGRDTWQQAMINMDFHYAMKKLAGAHFHVTKDHAEMVEEAKRTVLRARRHEGMSKDHARSAWDDIPDDVDLRGDAFVRSWADNHAVYSNELYNGNWVKIAPEVRGFWDRIWTPFIEHIKSDLQPVATPDVKDTAA